MIIKILKFILLSCLLLFLPPSIAPADFSSPATGNYRLIKLHYSNTSGEKGLTTFKYDAYGIMHKARWELLDGSRHSENYHTFDQNGNMIRKYREFSDGIISDLLYNYDPDGKLVSEYFERSDGVTGTVKYEYDKNGNQIKADCQGLNGWFYGIINYENNTKGQKIKGNISKKNQPVGAISYEYDQHGNLIKEYWDFSGQWSQTFLYEYESFEKPPQIFYTSSNVFMAIPGKYRVIKETYDYANQTGGPSFYNYDENGKLILKIFERSDGLKTETTYNYDENGILLSSHRKYSNDLSADFTYKFNGNRRLIRRTFKRSDGVTGSESYEYNGKWQLTKASYQNFDSWITGIITFIYNKNGTLDKGHFKGDKFDADIRFTSDENGNIIKIHWDFSFGKTQTYTFKYENKWKY